MDTNSSSKQSLPLLKEGYNDPISNRVWTLPELEILHELQKPVCVLIPIIHDDPHKYVVCCLCKLAKQCKAATSRLCHACDTCRYSGLAQGCLVVFQNSDFLRRFGIPRLSADSTAMAQLLSDTDKQEQEKWLSKILLVSHSVLLHQRSVLASSATVV